MLHIRCNQGDVAGRVIVCGDPGRARCAAEFMEGARLVNDNRGLLTYTGRYRGMPVTVSTTGMGAPSAAIVMEELAMLGAKAVIRVGTTGGIGRGVETGDVVVPSAAIPLDGATRAYAGSDAPQYPDAVLSDLVAGEAGRRGLRCHRGMVCSSDTFYLEEERSAEAWRSRGVLSFEMECAVIFALARLRKYRAAAILTVTGRIQRVGERVLNPCDTVGAIEKSIICALEALKSDVQQDNAALK
jgi:purine-nucleoside phosphorylase